MTNLSQLTGLSVWVTGPKVSIGQGRPDKLSELLRDSGANPLHYPLVRLVPSEDRQFQAAFERLDSFGTLVFVSAAGPRFFFEFAGGIARNGEEVTALLNENNIDVVAIGEGTAAELKRHGVQDVSMSESADSLSLARMLRSGSTGEPVLIVRADRGSKVLPSELEAAGVEFTQVAAYKSIDVQVRDEELVSLLKVGKIDWVAVSSSAIAGVLGRLYGELLGQTKIACISQNVADVVRSAGLEVSGVADEANFLSLRQAIMDWR